MLFTPKCACTLKVATRITLRHIGRGAGAGRVPGGGRFGPDETDGTWGPLAVRAMILAGIPRITGFRVPTICHSAAIDKPAWVRTSPVGCIDPRHEARARLLGSFRLISVAHGHTSPVGLPSIVARDAHAGSGGDRGRRSAISRRISANSVLGTATSAIWKAI